jgi:polyhydroxyalkanoate synthesis regulator phasin
MSNITIKTAALESTKDKLSSTINKLNTKNNKALSDNIITSDQHSQIFNDVQSLMNTLAELNVALINSIIDSITVASDSPAARLRSSIEQLNIAIDSIQNIRDLLTKITMVISDTQFLIGLL